MKTGQRIRYFLNEWSLIIVVCIAFAFLLYYASNETDWKPSAWILGVAVAFLVPFWVRKYFLVRSSINRTAMLGAQQHLGDVQGLDNISQAGTLSVEGYTPPARPKAPKSGIGLRWKIRLVVIGIAAVWAILDSEWKTIDKYFPRLNEVLHSGTPTSEGDVAYNIEHLEQDMQKWSASCTEKMGFKECRTHLIANKPLLDDLSMRVAAMGDAWTKELGEKSVPADCQTEMHQILTAYKDYVRVERNILALLESMDTQDARTRLQPRFDEASDQEDVALNGLHNLKTDNKCDGY